jgi:pyruvate/2-oxoglutarate dehydrogenase complex dihydrolipoamide dehydrogenase (E3) component
VAYLARRAPDYGVVTGEVSVDMAVVRQRKRDIVDSWRRGSERRVVGTENLTLLMAEARFLGSHTLELRRAEGPASTDVPPVIEASRIFINTGCRPSIPSIPGLDSVPYLTSTSIMELDAVPERLVVLGGGYVAVEFAQMFRRFGSAVTMVQRGERLLTREDDDVSAAAAAVLEEDGIDLVLGAGVRSVSAVAGGVRLELMTASGGQAVVGSHLLVATGRAPNTEALNLAAAGLKTDDRGFLPVNEHLETVVEGIYALGDVKGGPAFTHISYDDFRVIRSNLLEGGDAGIGERLVPYVIYMDPQLARCGLTEGEARARGYDVRAAAMPMSHVGRALEIDEARGLIKAVVDAQSDRILGCAVLGVEGGEVMSVLQMAMMGGVTASRLRDAVFAHPTLAESLNNLFARS